MHTICGPVSKNLLSFRHRRWLLVKLRARRGSHPRSEKAHAPQIVTVASTHADIDPLSSCPEQRLEPEHQLAPHSPDLWTQVKRIRITPDFVEKPHFDTGMWSQQIYFCPRTLPISAYISFTSGSPTSLVY